MINRSMQPRQMYGLGSLVKKAVKGVKNVIKSPIGKAAMLGAVGYGLGGGKLFGGSGFKFGTLGSRLGLGTLTGGEENVFAGGPFSGIANIVRDKFTSMSLPAKIFTGGGALLSIAAMFPQEEGEDDDTYAERLKRLEPLMNRYYSNVNPNASAAEVKKFILDNTQEYRAMGGRVGYRLGGDTMDREGIKSLEAGAPDVRYKGDMQMASETGPEEFEMDMLMELTQAFEEAKRQGFRGDFKSFLEMYLGDSARAPEGIMQEAPMQMAANGGRIRLAEGSEGKIDLMGDLSEEDLSLYDELRRGLVSKTIQNKEGSPQTLIDMLKSPFDADTRSSKIRIDSFNEGNNQLIYGIISTKNDPEKRKQFIKNFTDSYKIKLANGGMPVDEDEEDSYRAGVMQAMAQNRKKAMGGGMMQIPMGKIRMNEGGVIERDYRDKGGFVPVGIKEKADDVPAMLSKNEFVMTADAVRGAGGGSIEKGAQRMYDTMKSLERKIG